MLDLADAVLGVVYSLFPQTEAEAHFESSRAACYEAYKNGLGDFEMRCLSQNRFHCPLPCMFIGAISYDILY